MKTQLIFYFILFLTIACIPSSSSECMKVLKATPQKIEGLETGISILNKVIFLCCQAPHHAGQTGIECLSKNKAIASQIFPYVPLKIILAIIYLHNYKDPNGVDFFARAVVKETYFDALFIMSSSATWARAHLHYIISSREDFKCGTVTAIEPELLEPTGIKNERRVRLSYNIGWGNPKIKIIPYAYISGIKTEDLNFTLSISQVQSTFINQTLYLVVSISNSNLPIEVLILSYFAYFITGKVSTKEFPPTYDYLYSTLVNITKDDEGMNGMTGVNGPLQQDIIKQSFLNNIVADGKGKARLLTYLENNLMTDLNQFEISVFKKAFLVQEIDIVNNEFLEPILKSSFVNAPVLKLANFNICINFETCIENGGSVKILKDNRQGCVLCGTGKYFNETSEECECNLNFISVSETCIEISAFCGSGNIFQNGECFQLIKTKSLCRPDLHEIYNASLKSCVCEKGFKEIELSLTGKICISECNKGQYPNLSTGKCECPFGTSFDGISCTSCTIMQEWNEQSKKCVCKLAAVINDRGECLLCSPFANLYREKNICECRPGYVGNGLICRSDLFAKAIPPINY